MNYFELHIGDLTEATAHLSMVEDGAYQRLMRKYYATEKPLPADLKQVQRLAGARTREEREAVETVLAEFFELQSDGYHQSRCDAEIGAYHDKQQGKEGKKLNAKERQRRARARRAELFDKLRGLGDVPPFNATTAELEARLSRVTNSVTRSDGNAPVTRDDTATQTPDTRHQTQKPETTSALDTRAGDACKAMKQAGMQAVNPSDPRLLALIEAGATTAEIAGAAAEAVAGQKGFGWLLAAVEGRRRDAARIAPLPAARAEAKPWEGAR